MLIAYSSALGGAQEVRSFATRTRVLAGVFAALWFAGACGGKLSAEAPKTESSFYSVTVALGMSAVIAEESLAVELVSVKDNRCAVEVKCVWAGHAEITLRVGKPGAPGTLVVLGTLAPPSMHLPGETAYGSYRFSLLGLEPANSMSNPVAQAQYRSTIRVSKVPQAPGS